MFQRRYLPFVLATVATPVLTIAGFALGLVVFGLLERNPPAQFLGLFKPVPVHLPGRHPSDGRENAAKTPGAAKAHASN